MTLSYFAQNFLKLYDNDGNERPIKDNEMQFIKMLDSAFHMGCDLQLVTRKGKTLWVLKLRELSENATMPERILRAQIAAEGDRLLNEYIQALNNNNDTDKNTGSDTTG